MTNEQLENRLHILVKEERRITREILLLINLVEDQKLYLERGCDSLVRWLIRDFAYSEPAAYRRVQAARVLRDVPAVEEKVLSGELNLTTLAKAQSIFRAEEKRSHEKLSPEAKASAVAAIENQPMQKAERTLAGLFPEAMPSLPLTKTRVVGEDEVQLSMTMKRKVLALIERARELLGHALPEADLAEIVEYVFEDFCQRKDPLAKKSSAAAAESSKAVRRAVYQRDQGRCQYKDPKTGRKCGSRWRVEVDHIHPKALGGTDDPANLRCLCRAHNAYRARKTFADPPLSARNSA